MNMTNVWLGLVPLYSCAPSPHYNKHCS